jgi:ssDNA-binding Zn-finger/Zn-ribbon topoisomerase 1
MKRKLYPDLPELERLARNLEALSLCCTQFIPVGDVPRRASGEAVRGISGSYELGYWPSAELLQEIDYNVAVLALHCSPKVRGFFLAWEEFKYVDNRTPKLQLESRVGDLINRASAMLPGSESELGKAAREAKAGTAAAQCRLGDMVMKKGKFADLLQAEGRMEIQRWLAQPVARWIVTIGHPLRKHFVSVAGVDLPWKDEAEFEDWLDEQRRRRKSVGERFRKRRSRLKKNLQKA